MAEQQLEQIEGTVEDIIYENTDNGYMVFEVSGGGVVTVVCGIVGELHAGESVVCRGRYENLKTVDTTISKPAHSLPFTKAVRISCCRARRRGSICFRWTMKNFDGR